jgi:spermidine synthase
VGITLGAAIMSYYTPRIQSPLRFFAILQIFLAFIIIVQIKQFGSLSAVIHSLREFLGPQSYTGHIGSLLLGSLQIIIAPTVIMGACFPLAVRLFLKQKDHIGKETGILYAYNTSGTIIGSFAGGFILLPLLGIQNSLIFLALINLSLGTYLLLKQKRKIHVILISGAVILAVFIAISTGLLQDREIIRKAHIFRSSLGHKVELLNLSEDIYATVTVEKHTDVRGPWRSLSLNGVNVAGTSSELFSIQKLQGHLPLLLHPRPESVLHIGFGSGGTAWAVSRYPVKEITIAEISKSVIKKSAEYFKDINHDVIKDKRVTVHFTDGRNYILGTAKKFDVILSDSIHPRFSGNGSLYTYEYYHMLKQRLKPGGLVSFWLPFYSLTLENFQMIVKSFHRVFANTSVWYINNTINPYVIVIGRTGDHLISVEEIENRMKIPGVAADLHEIEIDTPFQLLDYFLFSREKVSDFTGDVPLHTDDNMAVEYISGQVINRQESILKNFVHLLRFRSSIIPLIRELKIPGERSDRIRQRMELFEKATRFNLMGQILVNDNRQKEAIALFEMVRKLNPLDLEPVEYFGASYQKPFLKKAKLR